MHPKDGEPSDSNRTVRDASCEQTREGTSSAEEEEEDDVEDGSSLDENEEESGSDGEDSEEDEEGSEVDGSESGSEEEGSDVEQGSGEASGSSEDDAGDAVKRTRPRRQTVIDSDSSDGQADRCPICLSRFLGQDLGSPESCEHMFCLDCIMEWSRTMNTCPVDRRVFKMVFMRKTTDGHILKKLPAHTQNAVEEVDEDATPCEICGRSDREDRLLLCDGCDQGFHLDCLNPPLADVPVEEWFCRQCDDDNPDEEAESETEAGRVGNDGGAGRRLGAPARRIARAGGTRLLPRTRQSELVRRRIQLTRATRTPPNNDGPSTSGVRLTANGAAVRRPRRAATTPRKRKTKRRKKTTTRKRKTTTRKSPGTTSSGKKTGTTKRRKTRRRRKTRSRKVTRRTKTVTVPSARTRLAEQLGVKKKLPQHFLPVMQAPSTSRWGRGRHTEPAVVGAESLQLFGQRDGLYAFADSYDDGEVATVGGVPAHIARPRKALSASAILSRRPVGHSGLPTRIASRVSSSMVAPSSFDVLGDILNCQTQLQKTGKDMVIQRDGTLRCPAPVTKAAVKSVGGSSNHVQCPMQPIRGSQPGGVGGGSLQAGGGGGAKDGGSSSSGAGHRSEGSSACGYGNAGHNSGGGDRRSGRPDDSNFGGGDHPDGRCTSTATDARKPAKKADEETKKPAADTDDDVDIYSDIETGSFENNDGGDHETNNAGNAVDLEDLEMCEGGDSSPVSIGDRFDRRASERAGGDDSCDAGRQSDVSSEDDLVIDESVKPPDDGGCSDADSEENDLVIDDDRDASDDDSSAKRSQPPAVAAAAPDSPSGMEEVSSADEEDEEIAPSRKEGDADADSKSGSENGGAAAAEDDSCSDNGDREKTAEVASANEIVEDAEDEPADSENDEAEEKICEEYNRRAAKKDELLRELGSSSATAAAAVEDADGTEGEEADEEEGSQDEADASDGGLDLSSSRDVDPAVAESENADSSKYEAANDDVSDEEAAVEDEANEEEEEEEEEDENGENAAQHNEDPLEDDEAPQESGDEVPAEDGDEVEEEDEGVEEQESEVEGDGEEEEEEEAMPTEENAEAVENDEECNNALENDDEDYEGAADDDQEAAEVDNENDEEVDHENDDDAAIDHRDGHDDDDQRELNESVHQSAEGEEDEEGNNGDSYPEDSQTRDSVVQDGGDEDRGDRPSDRSHRRRSKNLSSSRRRVASPLQRPNRRVRGGGGGARDYEEGEIVEESPPQHRRARARNSRPNSPPPNEGYENYEKDMPRVNMSDLPRIPKIRRDGGDGQNTGQEQLAAGADDYGADLNSSDAKEQAEREALERERSSVLARLEEDRVAAEISWKKLSSNSRTRNYRDNKAKAEQIRHVRGNDRKTTGVVTIISGGVAEQPPSSRKWATAAPPEPPPERERERDRERDRDKEKSRERTRVAETSSGGHHDRERPRGGAKDAKEVRAKDRARDRGRSNTNNYEKERYKEKEKEKEKDKHKSDRHKPEKVHRDWKDRSKHGSVRATEPVSDRSRERNREGGSRYEKHEKVVAPPPAERGADRKEKRDKKARGSKSRVPERVPHRDTKHREHKKIREKDKVTPTAAPPVVTLISREPSPIESKEVYASGDSIIVNVNFSRPTTGSKGDVVEVVPTKEDVGVRAFKIKERERERDPIKKLEMELRERKRQRLSEMEAHRKERGGGGRDRAKKRAQPVEERVRRDGSKRSRLDTASRTSQRREVLVKGSSSASSANRWNPFGDEAEDSQESEPKSGGSVSPILINDEDDDQEANAGHQGPLHSFEDNSDDDVVEILPSPEDDASKGGYQSDEPRSPVDDDTGNDQGDSFPHYDSPSNEPRPPCSPPSPADDNSVYDPFEPTKSPSLCSSPDPPPLLVAQQQQQMSGGKPDQPPLPPDMQPPLPPPEPPESEAATLPTAELSSQMSQTASTPVQVAGSSAASTAIALSPQAPSTSTSLIASVAPSVVTTQAPPPTRGLIPPMAMPNIRVPPPNYLPRPAAQSAASGAAPQQTGQVQMTAAPRPLNWPAGAPTRLLFTSTQQPLARPAAAFLRAPPPMGTRPMSLSQIGTLLHSQIASMAGMRAPEHGGLHHLQVPLGLPAALLQQSFGSLQQLAQSLSAGMPGVSQNGEVKRGGGAGSHAHHHPDASTEVVDMDVDSPYSPGETLDADAPQQQSGSSHHASEHGARSSRGGDRFDAMTGSAQSRKENMPARGEKSGGGHASTSKNRSHGASSSTSRGSSSRRKGGDSHSQRKHIVRFEVPDRQQAKASRGGGQKDGTGKKADDGKKEVSVKMDETQLKILDELPSSAVEMQVKEKFLKKLNRQERVIEEVKLAIKPFYNRREISKEEYKEILRKSVPKICHNKAGDINPVKIKALVDGYIKKFKYSRKKETKGGSSKKS